MRKVLIAIATVTLLTSCPAPKETKAPVHQEAKGPVEYGGVFKLNEVENPQGRSPTRAKTEFNSKWSIVFL